MKIVVAGWLLIASVAPSLAGYVIKTQVESIGDTYRYTWTVHNQDQSWGLDGFVVGVPEGTRVVAHTVPPPYANPDRNAYWVRFETREAQVDPHDNRAWLPAAEPGKKWIIWWGASVPERLPTRNQRNILAHD